MMGEKKGNSLVCDRFLLETRRGRKKRRKKLLLFACFVDSSRSLGWGVSVSVLWPPWFPGSPVS